jgi:hypothetical protein
LSLYKKRPYKKWSYKFWPYKKWPYKNRPYKKYYWSIYTVYIMIYDIYVYNPKSCDKRRSGHLSKQIVCYFPYFWKVLNKSRGYSYTVKVLVPDSSAIWLLKCGIRFTLLLYCFSRSIFILLLVRWHLSENGTRSDKCASREAIQVECEAYSTLHESNYTWVRDHFYRVTTVLLSTHLLNKLLKPLRNMNVSLSSLQYFNLQHVLYTV